MAKAKKDNRSSRSDRQFVRSLWRHLQRVPKHDTAASTLSADSNRSPQPILDDGPNGPHYQAFLKFTNRLSDLYTYWTGKAIS